MAGQRPHLFYAATEALCATCLRRVQAKEVIEDDRVWLLKHCPRHGHERVLLADDAAYWRWGRETFLKPGEQVRRPNTPLRYGCPYDCGICPEHEQHGCLTILEVTDRCNLRCPTCYAASGPDRLKHRSLAQIEAMLDRIVANEGEPDVVQISGGEPTLHPELPAIIAACKRRPIRHLMLNTNGIRIAEEDGFAEELAGYGPGFEIYLQFDSFRAEVLKDLRGADLRRIRERAIARLNAVGLSTTLVVTAKRGCNDDEFGAIIDYARQRPCVRGVTIQPVQDAGRNEGFDAAAHRLTLTEVRRRILEQSPWFAPADLIPVPCHADCLAMAYALKGADGHLTPLTGMVPPETLVDAARHTIAVEKDDGLRQAVIDSFAANHSPQTAALAFNRLLCCLPGIRAPRELDYRDVFRVIIMQFLDRHSLDLRNVRKSCVHIAHPDGKRVIPFDTYNIFYRDGAEAEVLGPLRADVAGDATAPV